MNVIRQQRKQIVAIRKMLAEIKKGYKALKVEEKTVKLQAVKDAISNLMHGILVAPDKKVEVKKPETKKPEIKK